MATSTPEGEYIKAILKRNKKLKNGIRRYVSKVCKVLEKLQEKFGSLPEEKNSLAKHFRDIFGP